MFGMVPQFIGSDKNVKDFAPFVTKTPPIPPSISTEPASVRFVRSIQRKDVSDYFASRRGDSLFTVESPQKTASLWETTVSGTHHRLSAPEPRSWGTDAAGRPVSKPVVPDSGVVVRDPTPEFAYKTLTGPYVQVLDGVVIVRQPTGTILSTGNSITLPNVDVIDISPNRKFALVSTCDWAPDYKEEKFKGGFKLALADTKTGSMRTIPLTGDSPFWEGALMYAEGAMISPTEAVFLVSPDSFRRPTFPPPFCGVIEFEVWKVLTHVDLETGEVTRLKCVRTKVGAPIFAIGRERQVVYSDYSGKFSVVEIGVPKLHNRNR